MNEFFKVLADETRLRCLTLIVQQHEVCVCELMAALDLPQSKISRHLSIIKLNGLITQRRHNQWVLYSLDPELSHFKHQLLEQTAHELYQSEEYKQDLQRLKNMKDRPDIEHRKDKHDLKCCNS